MRPAYDLTNPYDARRFLIEESPNTRFVPSGHATHDAGKITNVHNLTDPGRFDDARPSGDEALAALTLLADLRGWLADVEPDLIAAARDAGVTWDARPPRSRRPGLAGTTRRPRATGTGRRSIRRSAPNCKRCGPRAGRPAGYDRWVGHLQDTS
ncbi:hypothetical protein [Nonomuraea rubra]|uniref:Uncharacterized protein n=1 Tax=Nonomuraea rubra TaxID=46180 RepID=A0A7X0NX15_9ACTN|nr:hypothetical protein [Nonomuraea rubra]MBB6551202.1 hypothetical protein [Nonomuraea rubra]